jgi:glycogen phosphorylase
MPETQSDPQEFMHPAAARNDEAEFRSDFELNRRLPQELEPLDRISMNYFWSWRPAGQELFRELEPALWDRVEQHPRALLVNVSELRLLQKAADPEYVRRVHDFSAEQERYIAAAYGSADARAAYFCAEYGIHNSLPIYSGGLGILAGDHLKSASDLNVPLTAVGLLYRHGYFRQNIDHDGWQKEHYANLFKTELALQPLNDPAGERVKVMVHIRGREVWAQAWLAQVGRIRLYLLDTYLPENQEVDRLITGHLYGGDSETRIVQEKVLGIGGVRLLRKLGIKPEVFHLNEGHSAFLTLELATEYIKLNPGSTFEQAAAAVREQCVFTTHTPVAAGNDVFLPDQLRSTFSDEYLSELGLSESEFFALGRVDPEDESEPFGMTPFALRMSRAANGVSKMHGEVSGELWKEMYEQGVRPIEHVTNGVHPPTWIAPAFQRLYAEKIGDAWPEAVSQYWEEKLAQISDAEIWSEHQRLKEMLIAFIRERTLRGETGPHSTINERRETADLFSKDVLTIGFARRVAQYKRWDLVFSDVERLLKIVDNDHRPVQFVFAGKAHPQDNTAKEILRELMSINHGSGWQNRAVFIQDYDQEVARYLVHGVDVWMNVPRRPHEASGTSGMKAAMNGVLNLSVLDGWWIEGFNGSNGFSIGDLTLFDDDAEVDRLEGDLLYRTLEEVVVPLYYDRDESGMPLKWVGMMRNAISTLTPAFSSDRMVRDYVQKFYGIAG